MVTRTRKGGEKGRKTRKKKRKKTNKKGWYGIESAEEITEKIRRILRREGIKTYRKDGMRMLDIVRRKKIGTKEDWRQRGVIYEVPCGECDMVYVGETKKRLQERLKQHKDDVRLRRDTNAIFKHVSETDHEVNWKGATVVKQEYR